MMKKTIFLLLTALFLSGSLTSCDRAAEKISRLIQDAAQTVEPEPSADDTRTPEPVPEPVSETVPEPIPEPEPEPNPPEPEPEPVEPEPEPAVIPQPVLEKRELMGTGSDGSILSKVTGMTVSLSESAAEAYPELAAALSEEGAEAIELQKEKNAELTESALARFEESPEAFREGGMLYTWEENVQVHRADGTAFSYLRETHSYLGGAHPDSGYSAANYDTGTGKKLALTDVIHRITVLEKWLLVRLPEEAAALYGEYDGDPMELFFDLEGTLDAYTANDGADYTWTLDPEGVTFYFSPYEIAPYAMGVLTTYFSFAEYPELFREPYGVPSDGFCELSESLPAYGDWNGDGTAETLSFYSSEVGGEDVQDTWSYTIRAGSLSLTAKDVLAFRFHPYLVRTEGRTFLYVFADWFRSFLDVYELTAEEIRFVGKLDGHSLCCPDSGSDWFRYEVPVSAEDFPLDASIRILSDYMGFRSYRVGEDGMPVPLESAYWVYFSPNNTLTVKNAFEAALLDEDYHYSLTGEKLTLKPGDELRFLRTDGVGYVDMEVLGTLNLVRLFVDSSADGSGFIGGVPADELFEDILFGG